MSLQNMIKLCKILMKNTKYVPVVVLGKWKKLKGMKLPFYASFEFTNVRIGSKLQSYVFAKYIFGLKVTKNARNVFIRDQKMPITVTLCTRHYFKVCYLKKENKFQEVFSFQ